MRLHHTIDTGAADRVSGRSPIFLALTTLGFSYAELGRLMGVSTVAVHSWAVGKNRSRPCA